MITPSRDGAEMPNTHFDYLLNAMEAAAQAENPASQGYADKRKAVLDYVRSLEVIAAGVREMMHEPAGVLARLAIAKTRIERIQSALIDAGVSFAAHHAYDAVSARAEAASAPSSPTREP